MMELKIRETCPECKGTGEIKEKLNPEFWIMRKCKPCKGTGKVEHWVDVRDVFYKMPRR